MKKAEFVKTLADQGEIYKDIDHVLGLNDNIHKLREQINKKNADLSAINLSLIHI